MTKVCGRFEEIKGSLEPSAETLQLTSMLSENFIKNIQNWDNTEDLFEATDSILSILSSRTVVYSDGARKILFSKDSSTYFVSTEIEGDGVVPSHLKAAFNAYSSLSDSFPLFSLSTLVYCIETVNGEFERSHHENICTRAEYVLSSLKGQRTRFYSLLVNSSRILLFRATVIKNDPAILISHEMLSLGALSGNFVAALLSAPLPSDFVSETNDKNATIPQDLEEYLSDRNTIIASKLGAGSFSNVFLVTAALRQPGDGKQAYVERAVKIYKDEVDHCACTREIVILSKLCDCPHVPTILVSSKNWIVFNEVSVKLCKNHLNDSLVEDLLQGMMAVHQAGYRWSDCRPDNIGYLPSTNKPLLLDWNAAVPLDGTPVRSTIGTKRFGARRVLRWQQDTIVPEASDDFDSLIKTLFALSSENQILIDRLKATTTQCERAIIWEEYLPVLPQLPTSEDVRVLWREFHSS